MLLTDLLCGAGLVLPLAASQLLAGPPADERQAAPADPEAKPAPKPAEKPVEPEAQPDKPPPAPQPAAANAQIRFRLGRMQFGAGNRFGPGQDDMLGEGLESVFYPPDRATMQRLSKAQDLLKEKRYGEAARFLGGILEAPEDFFFQPNRDEPIFRSLKSEAQRLIGQMPADGRGAYELQYGAQARRMLDEAAGAGDASALAEVSRRFFHTQAGYEATFLLAAAELDRGRPLSAALCLKRLQDTPDAAQRFEPALSLKAAVCWRRAGLTEKAVSTLVALRRAAPDSAPLVEGRPQPLFRTDSQALVWLETALGKQSPSAQAAGAEQWAMYRGEPGRNAASLGSSPLLNRRWAVPTANDPSIEATLTQLRQGYMDQGQRALPALHPLAVNGFVFMRSVTGLEAVDFRTGKRIWNGPVDESVEQLLEPANDGGSQARPGNTLANWLQQRVWDDATYGTLSSDGENVYCIEDLGVAMGSINPRQIILHNGRVMEQQAGPRSYNRLAAYEIATEGKLKWDIGSQAGDAQMPLAGAFFMGPPLPLAGHLYALAEIKNEIRLVALDARTGTLQWSQQLAVLEQAMTEDPLRRVTGVSPSYSDGVLVCPTSATAVVAVDLTTRSLLWGYQYPRAFDAMFQQRMNAWRMGGMGVPDAAETDRWSDASVTIADGRVLLTPSESMHLHCLSLLDGKLLWQRPREDGLYVGCVHAGKVLVVGRRGLRCIRLDDGQSAWEEPVLALPAGSTPSGRGFFNGERYYLPLSTAEVAAVDVASGRVVARSKSRSGTVPGNLICYHGAVISQGVDFVESFYQLDDLRRQVAATLAEHPDDADALARQGELFLEDGKLGDAVVNLRRSFEIKPLQRTRELLVDALLEGLRLDFAGNRGHADEIERLVEQPAQRAAYLRLIADGLQQAGEIVPAFEAYLRMIPLGSHGEPLERIDNSLSVRRDRWVQARLAGLYETARSAERAGIDQVLAARFEAAKAAGQPTGLQEFVHFFGSHPLADAARLLEARRLVESQDLLAAEMLLRRLERSDDPRHRRAAAASLLGLLSRAGRLDEADGCYRQLAGPWAEQVCLDGKTGRQVIEELSIGDASRARLEAAPAWPEGLVKAENQKAQPMAAFRNFPLDFRGPSEPFFDRMTVELEQQQQLLVGRDGLGNERWRVSLRDRGNANNMSFNFAISHVRAEGHLLLVSMGYQLIAIDTLGKPGSHTARILWQQDLIDSMPGLPRNVGVHGRMIQRPWGIPQVMAADAQNRPLGNAGPLSTEMICFQRSRNLMAVEPLSGETLWTRADVQHGSEVFGDDELLFVTAPGESEARVLRALDGQELGRREVAPVEERILTLGRLVLSWSGREGRWDMTLSDVWQQKELWRKAFSLRSKVWPLGSQAIGVLQPDGRFHLVSLPDGATLIDQRVEADPNMSEIFLLGTPERYLLISNRPWQNKAGMNITPVPAPGSTVISGTVHGFDRASGKKVFSTKIEGKGLTINQPADLPILVFAANVYQQTPQGRGQTQKGNVLCLDKRNGRIVHQEELPSMITSVDVTSDPETHEVLLRTLRSSVRLQFTDEPWPAEAAAAGEEQASTAAKGGRAIVRDLKKFIAGRLAGGEGELEEDALEEQADDVEEEQDVIEVQREIEEAQQDVAEEQEP